MVGLLVGVTVAVALSLTTLSGLWIPLSHWECVPGSSTETGTFYLPLALVNSPYGGRGSVNSTYASVSVGYPSSYPAYQGSGGSMNNGSVWGAFVWETATVETLVNRTDFGAGSSDRCSSQSAVILSVVPASEGGNDYGGEIFDAPWGPEFGSGQPSDVGEPLMANLSSSAGNGSSVFHNGFYESNAPLISTCGTGTTTVPVQIRGLSTWIQYSGSGSKLASINLPIAESFSYWFPANFGTWEVDNLSAPGGPGGGWAFNFTGSCS